MSDINVNDIDGALGDLERLVEFYFNNSRGPGAYDRYRDYRAGLTKARAAMSRLYAALPDFRRFEANRADAYDRYVTRPREIEGCSCHLSAPCSFCTREADEDQDNQVVEGERV